MVMTLHPRTYNDVFHVGHYFREGSAVLMDLTRLTEDDATPLVIGRGGAMERVTAGVFLLLPPEEAARRARPATGPVTRPSR
jgi:FtsZ-interacting cell division protein YlmF